MSKYRDTELEDWQPEDGFGDDYDYTEVNCSNGHNWQEGRDWPIGDNPFVVCPLCQEKLN